MAGSKSLKDYLKKYESNSNEEEKKKKKKKKPNASHAKAVLLFDEDPVWHKPVNLEEDEEGNDSAEEEKPQVDEDIEVKRMKRLEQLRLRRPYNAISEDGSGWVSLDPLGADSQKLESDMSPPRKQRTRNDSPSPEPELRPPGSTRDATDLSPPRRQRNHQPSILPETEPEPEPKSFVSYGVDADLSPPRKRRARNDSPSPEPRLKRTSESSNLSHQRQQLRRYQTPSPELETKPGKPGRVDSDLSPPRKRHHTDLSPPRLQQKRHHTPSPEPDASISRRVHQSSANGDGDLSPPRKINKDERVTQRGGLIAGKDIGKDISRKKKEDLLRFQEMDPLVTGRGAEAVYRDKKGGRISKEEYVKSKEKRKEKPEEKKLEWGKGLAQKRETEARLQEIELEKDKPFARTRDDPDLDRMLKDQLRWGDPMAHLVKKKQPEPVLQNLGENEKMKESGFIIPQDIPSHSWIKRGLDAAPNRYQIRPGRHWDGVDRSNGYEKQLFTRKNEKQASEREAYLWSVADM